MMNWYQLDHDVVLTNAQAYFQNQYVHFDTCDLYLEDLEKGTIQFQNIDQNFYVSTHYVYEERLVKGNQTRYKVAIPLLIVTKNQYDVVYDTQAHAYCVYEEDGLYHFVKYKDFLALMKKEYQIVE